MQRGRICACSGARPYLLTDLFSQHSHTQHSYKYNLLISRWGVLYLQTILTHILCLWYSGHTAFKLVKRRCLFRLRRKTIPQHCTTILKTSFEIVRLRFWKCWPENHWTVLTAPWPRGPSAPVSVYWSWNAKNKQVSKQVGLCLSSFLTTQSDWVEVLLMDCKYGAGLTRITGMTCLIKLLSRLW
jgi:hypothetical protein